MSKAISREQVPASRRRKLLVRALRIFIIVSVALHVGAGLLWMLPAKIQEYREYVRKENLRKEAERVREERRQAEQAARQRAIQEAVALTRQDVVTDLKANFETILGEQVKPDAAEQLWNEILRSIQGDLDQYAEAAGNANASDQQVTADAQAMQAKMMDELLARLRGMSARHLADKFVENVQTQIAPKMAEYYRKQIDQRIGQPLNNEGMRIANEEAAAVRNRRAAAAQALTKAEQATNQAVTELNAAVARLRGQEQRASDPKADKAAVATAVKGEQSAVNRAAEAIRNAEAALKEAARQGEGLSPKTNQAIRQAMGGAEGAKTGDGATAVKTDGPAGTKPDGAAAGQGSSVGAGIAGTARQVADAKQAAGSGDAGGAVRATTQAVSAAKELAGAIKGAKESAAGDGKADPMLEARLGLRQARDGAIKGELDESFRESFDKSAGPRLSGKLTDVFAKTLDEVGAKDEKVVTEVRQRVATALGEKVRNGVDAGGAGTERLSKTSKLDELPADLVAKLRTGRRGPGDGTGAGATTQGAGGTGTGRGGATTQGSGGMDGAVASKLLNTARDLTNREMGRLDGPAGAVDGAGTGEAVARGNGRGGKGTGAGAGGDGEEGGGGDGEGGGGLGRHGKAVAGKVSGSAKALTDKEMANISNDGQADAQAEQMAGAGAGGRGRGRGGAGGGAGGDEDGIDAGLLDRVSTLREGVHSGRMSLLDGAGGGGAGNGPRNGPGNGPGRAGAGGGGMGAGRENGLSRLEQIRRQALVRGQVAAQRLRYSSSEYKEEDYTKLTAGIHERDARAAKGQVIQRTAAAEMTQAEVSKAVELVKDAPRPAVVLVPPAPKGELAAVASKDEAYKPTFRSIAFMAAPFRNSAVTIDGDLGEWKDIPAITLTPITAGGNAAAAANLRKAPQTARMQWDNKALYFAYDVIDSDNAITKATASDFWQGDGVEIWLDGANTKARERTAGTDQFWAWVQGASADASKVGGEAYVDGERTEYTAWGQEQMQVASRKTEQGWTMEVRLPVERLRNTELAPGKIMGMNFSVCTGTAVFSYWAGMTNIATSVRPDTWGDVMLAGSNAKVECVEKLLGEMKATEGTTPVSVAKIGQPLKVRVTDMDMNLSDARRDKVAATVMSRHGDREVVVLEETGEKTGTFEGSIPTALDVGDAVPGVVSLYDGEPVDVIYADQARGNGARNVEVKLTVPTAAAVTGVARK